MKTFPYYKMWVKDFDTNEDVRLLNLSEAGLYLFALNHAWVNDGLPEAPEDVARALRLTAAEFRRYWPRVSKLFPPDGAGRLRNSRQEDERSRAISKSNQASDAVAERERRRNGRSSSDESPDHLRGRARADSDSDYGSVSEVKKLELQNLREMPKSDFQARYESLYAAHPVTGFKADGQLRYLEVLSAAVNPELAADSIDRNHADYEAFWAEHPTEFRPGIGKYFEDGWYLRKPQAKARDSPPSRLTPTQQALQSVRERMARGENVESR